MTGELKLGDRLMPLLKKEGRALLPAGTGRASRGDLSPVQGKIKAERISSRSGTML